MLFLTTGPASRLAWQARGRKLFSMALMSFMFNLTIGLHSADTIYSWGAADTLYSWGTERHVHTKSIAGIGMLWRQFLQNPDLKDLSWYHDYFTGYIKGVY